tara:strand:- start:56 stop:829 length:774 start_codon:yes stop_codon:yes gene_type:complete
VTLDFRFSVYKQLCNSILNSGFKILRVVDFLHLSPESSREKYLILRHDVDRSPNKALMMAKIEKEYGIKSTYYFRTRSRTFKKNIMSKIHRMGHEIGYHYETLSDSRGDIGLAYNLFSDELRKFTEIGIEVKTIAMHGSPFSKFDNRDIWNSYDYSNLGILGEAYLDIDISDKFYFTDTGRDYSGVKGNVRDRPRQKYLKNDDIRTTFDLIEFIKNTDKRLYVSIHPDKWSKTKIGTIYQGLIVGVKSILKDTFLKR